MDPGPGVISVAHSYLDNVESDSEENDLLQEYFQSDIQSGGGEIEKIEYVRDHKNHLIEILIKYSDIVCSELVCAKPHYLKDIFPSYTSPDQQLVVKPHTSDDTESMHSTHLDSAAAGDSSQTHSVAGDVTETVEIEVYGYPDDCEVSELEVHFGSEPYSAINRIHHSKVWNERHSSYIFQFTAEEAERILAVPTQYLDSDDEETRLRIRPFQTQIREVKITGARKMNIRMLKKTLRPFGEVENCIALSSDQLEFSVTFADADAARKLADQQTLQLTGGIDIRVELKSSGDDAKTARDEVEQNVRQPVKEVMVRSDERLNGRLLRRVFKECGEIESCKAYSDDKLSFIVSFCNASDAEALANKTKWQLSDGTTLRVQLHDILGVAASPSNPSLSGTIDGTDCSGIMKWIGSHLCRSAGIY